MAEAYPSYHLAFIPAGCTGKAQPADVGLQRPFKHGITDAFTRWLSAEIHNLVKGGVAPAEVKVNTGLVKLKPLLVDWCWLSWDKLKGDRDAVKQAWERCGLSQVLDAAQQFEAMAFCMTVPEVEPQEEEEDEPQGNATDSKEEEEEEEEEEGVQFMVDESVQGLRQWRQASADHAPAPFSGIVHQPLEREGVRGGDTA